ncbi:MAG: dihydroorotase [Clostridiales bacterium]|nr:dihydroorotase [Clostridiales bacterium]MCF8022753.1 dihydroorotase [Clostridiales bacterium]
MCLLIKNGIVIDPARNIKKNCDVLTENAKIASVGESLESPDAEIIDAAGKIVMPGIVDMHVHLREPGFEAKETIQTGTFAALRGGVTSVACMPNTNPVADNASVINFILNRAKEAGNARVYPVGAITKNSEGKLLSEIAELKDAGAAAISDDGRPVNSAGVMRRAMQYASMLDLPVISHCENLDLAGEGVMHEGAVSTALGLKGIPASAEEVMVARDIILAEETGCRLHIAHVSTARSIQLVREAKARGVNVTAEVAPHHFTLTHEAVKGYNTFTKVNPPLREAKDVEAVKEGLADGTIDVIATDHAPHTMEEKDVEYDLAPFGIAGVETAAGLIWNELVKPGILNVEDAVAKITLNPARILGICAGTLVPGMPADIIAIEPNKEWEVDPEFFAGRSKNTPFAGKKLTGKVLITILNGIMVYKH